MAVGLKPTQRFFLFGSVGFRGGRWGEVASSINSRENRNAKYLPQFIHSSYQINQSSLPFSNKKIVDASLFIYLFL